MNRIKDWNELTITDDYMFCKVMQNEKICRKMISLILGTSTERISKISYQETIDPGKQKGIRLDVLVKDGNGRVIDFEMQMTNQHNLPKRSRYYLSAIDVSELGLQAGQNYNQLAECYIVFICPFDFFGKGLPKYTMKTVCVESGDVFEDGVTKIILNSKAAGMENNRDLRGFLTLMNGEETKSDFALEIKDEINRIKNNVDWRTDYMILKAREMDLLEEGREEGREEERIQAIKKIRQHLKCSTVEAMDILGIPADLREKYADVH